MRGRDNYKGAFDYITKQLFPYNYNNSIHKHLLKLKMWALDSDILEEEKIGGVTIDKDFYNPLDHKESLLNELSLLDLYRKTEEGLLEEYDQPFDTVMEMRKEMVEMWLEQEDPITNKPRELWEMPYSSRPLLMSIKELKKLYELYKVKEANGELSNCIEILTKITEDNLDTRKYLAEMAILSYIAPNESEQQMLEQATKLKLAEDDDLVKLINDTRQKIIDECIKPKLQGKLNINPVPPLFQLEKAQLAIVGVPSLRIPLVAQRHHSGGRKGYIIETPNRSGGYRYPSNEQSWLLTIIANVEVDRTLVPNPDPNYQGPPSYTYNSYSIKPITWTNFSINVQQLGQSIFSEIAPSNMIVEKNWNYFALGALFTETITSQDPNIPSSSKVHFKAFDLGMKDSRFLELAKRWTNFNIFREHKIDDVGLRYQIESMLDTDVPYIKDKLIKQFNDLKEEKEHIYYVLKEDCLFGEWI